MSQFSELSLYKLYKLCLRLILHYLNPLINSADVPHQDLYFLCVKTLFLFVLVHICIESADEVPRDKCSCQHFQLLTCDQITWLQTQTAPLEKPQGRSAHLLSFCYCLICFSLIKSLFLTELCDESSESLGPSAETRRISQFLRRK